MINKRFLLLNGLLMLVVGFCATAQTNNTPGYKLNMALTAIERMYVDDVQSNTLVEEAIKAMVSKLDPHSAYMTADEMREMNEPLLGGFDGIGISFDMLNDTLFVVEVIAGGPSEKVGLLPGDRLIKVDGELIAGVSMSNKEIMKRLKGPKGTLVVLDVQRRGQPGTLPFRIIRDKIPLYSLDAAFMVDKNTGYIKLNRFGATTAVEFREAFVQLQSKGMEDLVLDLQSNGGGLMGAAIEMANEFLSEGKCIVYTEGKHSPRMQSNANNQGLYEKGKLVVLIDEYSASASEILAGAIQDWDRGLIIGRRSYGKGLVQQPIPLPDGSTLKLTVSRYFTPSGRFIQKPYEDTEKYDKDLIDRYNRGEMIHADSIHFPDSLKTHTLVNRRTIYGGGGIMPDIFVPYDTTKITPLLRTMSTSGFINSFSLEYVDAHRKSLTERYPTAEKFISGFSVSDSMVNGLIALALREKVVLITKEDSISDKTLLKKQLKRYPTSEKFISGFSVSDSMVSSLIPLALREKVVLITKEDSISDKTLLKKQLKAFMIRDLWKASEYYKVMWDENESLVKALEILNDKNKYKLQIERD